MTAHPDDGPTASGRRLDRVRCDDSAEPGTATRPCAGTTLPIGPMTGQAFAVARSWSPSRRHAHPAEQQPEWPDEAALDQALKQIASYPPLVFAGEARSLQTALGHVAAGNAFLLQAGDCAE